MFGKRRYAALGDASLPLAAACGVAGSVVAMQATRTVHPPASGTALIGVLGGPAIHAMGAAIILPTVASASVLVAIGLGNNLIGRQYPTYWV